MQEIHNVLLERVFIYGVFAMVSEKQGICTQEKSEDDHVAAIVLRH